MAYNESSMSTRTKIKILKYFILKFYFFLFISTSIEIKIKHSITNFFINFSLFKWLLNYLFFSHNHCEDHSNTYINAISLFLSLPPLSISISRSKWIISIKRKKANTPEQNLAQPTIKVDQATTSISSNLSDNLKALITLSCFIFTKNCVSTYRN